jgi:hypothetical protein
VAALGVFPAASHLLLQEHGDAIVGTVADFLKNGRRTWS